MARIMVTELERHERAAAAPLALWFSAALVGCAGPSATADLSRVRELSNMPLEHDVTSGPVDVETRADVRALLEKPLSADAAVRIALLNNRHLRATLRSLGVPRGQLVQAGLLPNPVFEIEVRRPVEGNHSPVIEMALEFDLTHALLSGKRTDVARAELEAARHEAAAEVVSLGYSVRSAFYALQAAEQRYAVAQRLLDAQAAGRDAARALFDAGNISELDLATHEAAYEEARATAAELELEVLERKETMQVLLGLYGEDTAWRTTPELPRVPSELELPDDIERRALLANLNLKQTRSHLEALAERTGLARAEGFVPDIALGIVAEREDGVWELGGGAAVRLPVFDRQQGNITSFEAQFDALLEQYHGAAIELRSAARRLLGRLQSALLRARQYQEVIVPARTRVMQQTLLQYNAMQLGVFELLQARRGQLEAELAHIDALRELWTARAAVDALLAGHVVEHRPASTTPSFSSAPTQRGH